MSQRVVSTVTGRSPGDHVCWPFHGPEEYVEAARAYVAEGLDRHERVAFVKVTPAGLRHAIVSDVAQVGRPADDRGPVLTELTAPPGWSSSTSAPAQFDRMTRAAVADGYAGMRLLTDVNELVRTPDGLQEWMRNEHLIDRYTLDHPLLVLCGYDADDLDEATVAEAARVHPLTGAALSAFALLAADADGGLALSGEVDIATADDLHRALMAIGPEIPAQVTVDMSEVDFIDHSSLLALDRAARSLAVTMTLVGAEPLTRWLVGTLGLSNVTAGAVA
jgi:anti-anti-sigma regulatory factor